MFIHSLLFGNSGNYLVLGVPITFQSLPPKTWSIDTFSRTFFAQFIRECLNSKVFRFGINTYTHIFFHEMGHALIGKYLCKNEPKVFVFRNAFGGMTTNGGEISSKKVRTAVYLSGPLASVTFSSVKLAVAALVHKYVSRVFGWLLATQSFTWLFGELFYASTRSGDYQLILTNGDLHYFGASIILALSVVLAVWAPLKLYKL